MVRDLALWMPVLVHIITATVARTIMMSQGPFSSIVNVADQLLWDDYTQSQLGVVTELVDIKSDGHISERIYDRISQWANRILPSNHTLRGDYYSTKKLVKDLGLPIEKIHACKNGCMFYWKDDVDLEYYKFCGDAKYKPSRGPDPHWKKSPYVVLRYLSLTPRLQRLYSLRATVKHITWHATHQTWEGMIVIHPMPRRESILIGCILILQTSHVMLGWAFEQMMVIPGPSNPKRLIDVYLEPLIEELLQLWHLGVRTYDHATDRAFMMRAALMWTMNDLPMEWHLGGVPQGL
ncbi:UNVERIFIED_CONTAM: hypothetical protein Sradi_4540400 [Sesamum radiatum]|uniref:Uncharacterized protein n=1 Tax=Sesamum radiatum TaxID=300843 RepID=A0AAW2NCW0_SESRA